MFKLGNNVIILIKIVNSINSEFFNFFLIPLVFTYNINYNVGS
jgi:hypothetical protein